MEAKWLINPDYANLEASVALAKKYGAAFEYNDFFYQEVYTSEEEVEKHMQSYFELNRDRGQDMLHSNQASIRRRCRACHRVPRRWRASDRRDAGAKFRHTPCQCSSSRCTRQRP